MKDNILQKKSYDFALKIVRTFQHLSDTKREFVLSKQLLRSGTSIAANIEEAIGGQSERDFFAKDSGYIDKKSSKELISDVGELLRIIGSIQITMKKKFNNTSYK